MNLPTSVLLTIISETEAARDRWAVEAEAILHQRDHDATVTYEDCVSHLADEMCDHYADGDHYMVADGSDPILATWAEELLERVDWATIAEAILDVSSDA